jgi:hypothetical protein
MAIGGLSKGKSQIKVGHQKIFFGLEQASQKFDVG